MCLDVVLNLMADKCAALCQAVLVNKNLSDPSGQVKLKARAAQHMPVIEVWF